MKTKNTIAVAPQKVPPAKRVALADIKPSKKNPRKSIDPVALRALADSIESQGVLQAILIRENISGGAALYEIVAGERRWRAAKLAGLTEIPASLVVMTDGQAADARLVENDQRADISALDRAAAYQERIDGGEPLEALAKLVGKSLSTVREALLLGRCPPKLAEALTAGAVSSSTASLVCRVPNPALREKVSLHVLAGQHYWSDKPKTNDDGVLSYRDTKSLIHHNCMVELKAAPFDPLDATLVPAAGPCPPCPKRLGNLQKSDPEGFPSGRGDVCMDPECYGRKVSAVAARAVAAAKADGRKILGKKESASLFTYGGSLSHTSPYFDLDRDCSDDSERRSYRQILQADLGNGLGEKIVIGIDDKGKHHELMLKADAKANLKAAGIVTHDYSPRPQRPAQTAAQFDAGEKERRAELDERMKLDVAMAVKIFAAIGSAAEIAFGTIYTSSENAVLRIVARTLLGSSFYGIDGMAMGSLLDAGEPTMTNIEKAISAGIDAAAGRHLFKFIAWGTYCQLKESDEEADQKAFLSALGLDATEIAKGVRAALAPAPSLKKAAKKALAKSA